MKNKIRLSKFLLIFVLFNNSCKKIPAERSLKLETYKVTEVNNILSFNGEIIDLPDGGVEDYGFIYSIDTPNLNKYIISLGARSERGKFSATLDKLPANNYLFFKAYAKLNNQYYYGNNFNWFISAKNVKIDIGSPQIENSKSVNIKGKITDLGSFSLMEYGHCFSYKPGASIQENKILGKEINQNGEFLSSFPQLLMDTNIYVRTYAKLSDRSQPIYSQEVSFILPTLKISSDSSIIINDSTVKLQGNFKSIGLDGVTEFGFVWSNQNPFPNYNNNKLLQTSPAKNGVFYQNIENVKPKIYYYYRAFASNGSKVFYGQAKYFKL